MVGGWWLMLVFDGFYWMMFMLFVLFMLLVFDGWYRMMMLGMLWTVDGAGWWSSCWFEDWLKGWSDDTSHMVVNYQVKFPALCSINDHFVDFLFETRQNVCRLLVQGSVAPLTWRTLWSAYKKLWRIKLTISMVMFNSYGKLPEGMPMASSQVDGRLSSERSWTASAGLRAEHQDE